jgi:hypothetical protein
MSRPSVDPASTANRLLRLVLPLQDDAHSKRVSHRHLMDESERRLCLAAHCGQPVEELVATRILDNARDYHRWESEHARLMQRIAVERSGDMQKIALLSASLDLIHRKALFEYLREGSVRGEDRRRLIAHFFSRRDYERAVVAEHGNYLRSAASYMCSSHVGQRLLLDDIFDQPLQQYETLYSQYFRAYCESAVLDAENPRASYAESYMMLLKQQVNEWRGALHALANSRSGTWRRPNFAQLRTTDE